MSRPGASLPAPSASIATNTERTFALRAHIGRATEEIRGAALSMKGQPFK